MPLPVNGFLGKWATPIGGRKYGPLEELRLKHIRRARKRNPWLRPPPAPAAEAAGPPRLQEASELVGPLWAKYQAEYRIHDREV